MIRIKQIATIVTIALLISCCANHSQTNTKSTDELEGSEKVYLETAVNRENVNVAICRDTLGSWSIIYSIDNDKHILDLEKEGIFYKEPELMWSNGDYACIMTWWSQAQSRHIFIPLKKENSVIYLNKNIEEMDSINNNIVYIDTVYYNKDEITFAVENILTRKNKKAHPIIINEHNSIYPFFDSITMTRSSVTIITGSGNETIDISGLY